MLVFNQQANIKNVNGAIADTLANRPAPQSTFYIFYSIDTQEIYYDNGTWVLIGTGGGGTPVNIYNSDGTLTGDRTLYGANRYLQFLQLDTFYANANGKGFIQIGQTATQLGYNDTNILNNILFQLDYVALEANGFTNGFKLETFNKIYSFGQLTGNNLTNFTIDDTNQIIKTLNQNNDIGLKLDFANSIYELGQLTGGNTTNININDNSRKIATKYAGFENGIILDFASQNYQIGELVTGSRTQLFINNTQSRIFTRFNNLVNGLDITTQYALLGFIQGAGNTNSVIVSRDATQIKYNNVLNGLNIEHNAAGGFERYDFGRLQGAASTQYKITLTDSSCFLNYKNIFQMGCSATQGEIGFTTAGANILLNNSGVLNMRQLTQLEMNGTGITQGTSGAVSGQHLKVTINGVNYVIELKNP